MAKMTKKDIEQRMASIHGTYTNRFAGHPRATRDVAELDKLIKDTKNLLKKSRSLQRHTSKEVRDMLNERMGVYETERQAILDLQMKGSAIREASLLGSTANFVHARYQRHFAGYSRSTRDLALLEECLREMTSIDAEMAELAGENEIEALSQDREVVSTRIELYKSELTEVRNAQRPEDKNAHADLLASLANAQFETYRVHFANRKRTTRRVGLIERIIRTLTQILGEMNTLKSDISTTNHNKNIRVVEGRLDFYKDELEAIQTARSRANINDLVLTLGQAANDEMAEYREHFAGKDRATRELDRLSQICDRLGEIEQQMRQIDGRADSPSSNARNLSLVRDRIRVYEREFEQISAAKAEASN